MKTRIVLLGICFIALYGCVQLEIICADAVEARLSLNLKQKLTLKDRFNRDSIVVRDTFVFIKFVKTKSPDTILFAAQTPADSLKTLRLPYNPLQDSLKYIFYYNRGNSSEIDTLLLNYTRQILLTSPRCGIRTDYKSQTVAYHTFDSIAFKNLQNNAVLEIFYFAN